MSSGFPTQPPASDPTAVPALGRPGREVLGLGLGGELYKVGTLRKVMTFIEYQKANTTHLCSSACLAAHMLSGT